MLMCTVFVHLIGMFCTSVEILLAQKIEVSNTELQTDICCLVQSKNDFPSSIWKAYLGD